MFLVVEIIINLANRWRIIIVAVMFNMLFEYSLRGLNNLRVLPILPFILVLFYFTYYTILEDLIVRYRFKDYNLLLLTFIFGLVYGMFISGDVFFNPQILGVNFTNMLYGNFIWGGLVQGVMTFYIANRLSPRDWNHKRLTKTGWIVLVTLNIFVILLFQLSGKISKGTIMGFLTISMLIALFSVMFWKTFSNKSRNEPLILKSMFFDVMSTATVAVFLMCATVFTYDPIMVGASMVNATSLKVILAWTTILAICTIAHRLATKKPIPI